MTGMFSCDPLKAPVISASFYLIDSPKVSRLDSRQSQGVGGTHIRVELSRLMMLDRVNLPIRCPLAVWILKEYLYEPYDTAYCMVTAVTGKMLTNGPTLITQSNFPWRPPEKRAWDEIRLVCD